MKNEYDEYTVGFQGKHPDEELQFYTRQHWIRLCPSLLRLFAWNAFLFALWYIVFVALETSGAAARNTLISLIVFFFLLAHFEFLDRFYRHFLYTIVITDKKIHRIKKSLICTNDHQSVDLWMLQDINKCQHGFVQNLLGYGSLILEAQDTVMRLHFLPHIGQKYKSLMHLREQARKKMSYAAADRSTSESVQSVWRPKVEDAVR